MDDLYELVEIQIPVEIVPQDPKKPYVRKNVISAETVEKLLEGSNMAGNDEEEDTKQRRKRRKTEWPGARFIGERSPWVDDVFPRGGERVDYTIPRLMDLFSEAEREAITKEFEQMAELCKGHNFDGKIRSFSYHIMTVPPGASAQEWHVDNYDAPFFYTMIVALTEPTPGSGRTEFQNVQWGARYPQKPLMPGSFLMFDGRTVHRGMANTSSEDRIFCYIAASAKEVDGNLEAANSELLLHEKFLASHKFKVGDELVTVREGQMWEFCADDGFWQGVIEEIVGSARKKEKPTLTVRWFYKTNACAQKELLYSKHFDDCVELGSLVKRIRVNMFGGKKREGSDYYCNRFLDFKTGEIRPLEKLDVRKSL